ncbi:MAG TPA: S46 family peptidase, partial [Polyangiaceae bacterium]
MSRYRASLAALLLAAACSSPVKTYKLGPPAAASASERPSLAITDARAEFANPGGMWLPGQLAAAHHADTLERLGLELDTEQLSDPTTYPLAAVVSLGGCSASFVSPEGLVITNHHCVTGALQHNSTPEQNLIEQGYLAKSPADEKSVGPTGRVFVTQAFTDVTETVRRGLEAITDDQARHLALERQTKELVLACEKAKPNVRCDVASYFGGGQYLLIERLEIKDVRLVYAPHEGIGNFGGDIDNWRWPRHGGDFAFYRAYVGKDGKPAPFHAANVPYRSRQYLKLASKPLRARDLVFVAGYPGRTYRLQTVRELREATDWWYPRRIKMCEEYLGALAQLTKADPKLAIKTAPLDQGLNNSLIYTRGSLEGLVKGGAAAEKQKLAEQLAVWIAAEPARKEKYSEAFAQMDKVFAERERTRDSEAALDEWVRMSSLLNAAVTIVRMAEERPKPDAERKPEYQQRNWEPIEQSQRALDKRYARALDMALTKRALERALRLPPAQHGPLLQPLFGRAAADPAQIDAVIARLYDGTRLESSDVRVRLLKTASTAQLRATRDPMLQLALALRPLIKEKEDREEARNGALLVSRPVYVAALREFKPEPVAPDANGTLRVTYGTVRGYRPAPNAPVYRPFTVISQMTKKNTGKAPFNAPQRLLDAVKAKKFGPYVDAELGEVPIDFLTDLDITGGNSGSATLNTRGELVGLAFDGNYEAMASDWLFMPDISRSIHVDLRYILWVMDAVDGADWLLEELGVR